MKKVEERTKQRSKDFLGYFVEEKGPIKRIELIIGRFEDLYRKKEAYLKEHHSVTTAQHTLGETFECPMEQLLPKRQKTRSIEQLVPYEDTEEVGDTKEVATVLQSLKGDIEVDHPIIETSSHKHEERMGDVEKTSTKVYEDEREIAARRFIEDDEFIKTSEFKDFWMNMKIKEFQERM